jgi:hypothetical protein
MPVRRAENAANPVAQPASSATKTSRPTPTPEKTNVIRGVREPIQIGQVSRRQGQVGCQCLDRDMACSRVRRLEPGRRPRPDSMSRTGDPRRAGRVRLRKASEAYRRHPWKRENLSRHWARALPGERDAGCRDNAAFLGTNAFGGSESQFRFVISSAIFAAASRTRKRQDCEAGSFKELRFLRMSAFAGIARVR